MRSRKAAERVFFALVLILTACRREPVPKTEGLLERATQQVRLTPPCSSLIPQHFSYSLPLPTIEQGRIVYRLFFYGWEGSPTKGILVHTPEGEAAFTPGGEVLSCVLDATKPRAMRDVEVEARSPEEVASRRKALCAQIERLADLWAAGKPLVGGGRKDVAEFSTEFKALAHPGHAPAYRKLSSGFWDWIEQNGGNAPTQSLSQ